MVKPRKSRREAQAPQVRQARTELWYAWAEIAIDHEYAAKTGRAAAADALDRGDDPSRGIEAETKAAMGAVAAAAACLEALTNDLQQFMPEVKGPAARRVASVVNGVIGYVIGPELAAEIRWLFAFRNDTVHYRAQWQEMVLHPAFGLATTGVAATYTCEAAARCVDIMTATVRAAVKVNRTRVAAADWWRIRWAWLPQEIDRLRQLGQAHHLGG